jgi:hypothetical protein
MKSDEEREYEERLKRRVLILQEMLKEGKMKIPYDSQVEKSLTACRYDSNGEPDLSTIDGAVRSMALMAEHFHDRQQFKDAISLAEIQNRYFEGIHGNFDFFYNKMIELKLTPHETASQVAYGDHKIDYIHEKVGLFLKDIVEFWEIHSEAAYIHVEDSYDSIKAVFGGDLFPANDENIASKCGIYTDTIVLPCPFVRSKNLFDRWDKKQQVYYLLKHALNVLQYKTLAIANTKHPIIVILPDKEMMSEEDLEQVTDLGNKDALFHAGKIFNRDFDSLEELFDFANRLDTVDKVIPQIKDSKRVLFDLDNKESLEDQIIKESDGQSAQLLGTDNPGTIVAALGIGRMNVCNEILLKSARLRGTPLIDAPTSWQYFKWKMEYDAERTHPDEDFNKLHIVKGLNHLSDTSLQWIGKIPPEGLIELRKSGAMDEIREILSKGIDELTDANNFDFTSTSHKVFNNLNFAFNQHQTNIKNLIDKKWKVAGKDLGSWLVMGSIEIAAACIGTPLYGLSSVVLNQILDAPKLKDIPKSIDKIKEYEKEKLKLKKSPLGLMFKYKV